MSEAKGVLPHGESLRRALRWLDGEVKERPTAPRGKLVDEAAARFDLSPLEVEFLLSSWGKSP
ncbi:MAG TPA: hypothetical protein VIV59_02060 [Anaeromyxobacteraceae bacterium]